MTMRLLHLLVLIIALLFSKVGNASVSYIAILPDLQSTSQLYPWMYPRLRNYLVDLHPEVILFVGDAVEDRTGAASQRQWEYFTSFYNGLTAADLKVVIAPGNHDYADNNRTTVINQYLIPQPWLTLKDANCIENSVGEVWLAGKHFVILSLEYSPRTTTVTWANSVINDYEIADPDIQVILTTHVWLYSDGERYDRSTYDCTQQLWSPHCTPCIYTPNQGIYDGEELWQALGLPHSSLRFVFSGHIGLEAERLDSRVDETTCLQVQFDFQDHPLGNWVLVCRFDSDNSVVDCQAVSPIFKEIAVWPNSRFEVTW